MGISIKCVWCDKPLIDVEHAKKHVATACSAVPWHHVIEHLRSALLAVRLSSPALAPEIDTYLEQANRLLTQGMA